MKTKLSIYTLILLCSFSYGQMKEYTYKRELTGITDQWHSLAIPNAVFSNTSSDLSDIRIYGITTKKDTIEAPYLLKLATEKASRKEVHFQTVNTAHNTKGYYFTFKIPSKETINQIQLDFKQQNFDWLVSLEGSQNQQEWFTITEDYRILSINNDITNYNFTKISVPNSNYQYYRLLIKSKEKPDLITAKIALTDFVNANYKEYSVRKSSVVQENQLKQTIIDLDLGAYIPLSYLKINIQDTVDYYRPVTIKFLTDSINTEKGYKYTYRTLFSGTLNSIEKNEFRFPSTPLQKLKIIIRNHDNAPLKLKSYEAKGYHHEVVARFTESATYYLTYGNTNVQKPEYDISRFTNNVPTTIAALQLKEEQKIEKKEMPKTSALFENKFWLWGIMGVIILVLGWFSLKMIKEK